MQQLEDDVSTTKARSGAAEPEQPKSTRRSAMQTSTIGAAFMSLQREFIGELIGTFMFLVLGFGVICTATLGEVPLSLASIAAVWGIGVALGIGVSSALSESHLNPAVTLAMVLFRGFELKRAAVYWLAQVGGSTVAALLLGVMYLPQINKSHPKGADFECTIDEGHPLPFQINWPGLPNDEENSPGVIMLLEALAASILVACVLRLDPGNGKPQHLGAAVCALILVFAPLSGAGFNPARDLGPRIASGVLSVQLAPCLAGFGGGQWWPYTIGPLLGAAIGGGLHGLGSILEKSKKEHDKKLKRNGHQPMEDDAV